MSAPSILSLPPELATEIIDHPDLSYKDVAALRFTCKELHSLATEVLAKRRLSKIAFPLTFTGLKRFSSLTKTHFGPHLRFVFVADLDAYWLKNDLRHAHPSSAALRTVALSLYSSRSAVRHMKEIKAAMRLIRQFESLQLVLNGTVPITLGSLDKGVFRQGDQLANAINSEYLSELTLNSISISAKALIRLLDKHRETIRIIKIWRCVLGKGSWNDALHWIQQNLTRLNYCSFNGLFSTSHINTLTNSFDPETFVHSAHGTLKYDGQVEIQKGLTELLQEHSS